MDTQQRKQEARDAATPEHVALVHAAATKADTAGPVEFLFQPVRTHLLRTLTAPGIPFTKVTSIVAPIGYGKTVLLSQLYAHRAALGDQCHWIGLDDRAQTAQHVVQAIETALQGKRSGPTTSGTQALLQGQRPHTGELQGMVDTLAQQAGSVSLFIDNLDSCGDDALGGVLNALVFDTSAAVRLFWTSTVQPAIDWGRAKLEGRVREARLADLCLDKEEVRALLGANVEGHIGPSGVDTIFRQTEGWPAAVRLAQIALANTAHPSKLLATFSGSDEDIAALLNRKVLQTFSAELRHFLLCLAQLRTFNVPLCRAVLPDIDVEPLIDMLIQRNIFVIPMDRNRQRYRLHSVFREYLLSEAERHLAPAQQQDVLRRASAWSERHADWRNAIDYAVRADDLAAAGRVLERSAPSFFRDYGDIPLYIEWARRLEAEHVTLGWETQYLYAWALVYRRNFELARIQLESLCLRLKQAQADEANNAPSADLPSRIDQLRVCIDLFGDRIADAERSASAWLAASGTHDAYSQAAVLCIKSCCLASNFQFREARAAMAIAAPIMRELSGTYSAGWVLLINSMLAIHEGKYAETLPELMTGRERVGDALGTDAGLYGNLSLAAALCAVETGRDQEALDLVMSGLQTAHSHGLVDTIACGLEAAVKLWDGSAAANSISPTQLRKIAASYPPRLSLILACHLIRRLVRLGRLHDAQEEAERVGLLATAKADAPRLQEAMGLASFRDLWTATTIDLLLAKHDFAKAQALVDTSLVSAKRSGRVARQIELGLDKAVIAINAGNRKLAAKELTLAVIRATPQGTQRPFLDRSAVIGDLISSVTASSPMFALNKERAFFNTLRSRIALTLSPPSTPTHVDTSPIAAPTQRELELLRLIERGLSNEEIAAYANASLNTIKWHLKNLYRKLGVSNRAGAITRARSLNLLG